MARQVAALAFVLVLSGACVQRAEADVYTWVDAAGNVNVSNLAPPAGTKVRSIAREDPAARARAEAARAAAKDTELRALTERVAELERANEPPARPPGPPYMGPPPYAVPPPPRFSVTMMPSAAEEFTPPLLPSCGSLDCVPTLGSPFYAPSVVVIAPPVHRHHGRAVHRSRSPATAPSVRGPRRS